MDTPLDLATLQQWIGKTHTQEDVIQASAAAALASTLDLADAPAAGAALPPMWHWIYFWSVCRQSEVGADGHPPRGAFLPPVPLPRRMWAGGRLRFTAPLPVGAVVTRTSRIASVETKQGKTGPLAFVTVVHEFVCNGVQALHEEHDIVYREMPQPGAGPAKPQAAPTEALWRRSVTPDPVLLFRYSALTFNGHRIHYDRSYATETEGYPGLVVHGPLIATLLGGLLAQHMPDARLAQFDFRAVGSLFDSEPFALCGQPDADGKTVRLWAQNMRGELAMQAEAVLA
jgi:3-methylfumaryl-CoA hydratase